MAMFHDRLRFKLIAINKRFDQIWTFEMILQQPDLQLGISSWTPKRGCSLIQSSTEKKNVNWSSVANLEHQFTIFIPKTSLLNRALRLIFSSQKRTTFVWVMVNLKSSKRKTWQCHPSVDSLKRSRLSKFALRMCPEENVWLVPIYYANYLSSRR